MSVFQETSLQGLARLSLVKSILTWPFTICSIYSHSKFPKFLETRKLVKTSENWKLNCHIADVSLGGESIFGKVHRTSTSEHFTVEPQVVQLTWNFVDDLLVCICSQEILFEEKRWWFGEAIKYTKVYQWGWCIIQGWMAVLLYNSRWLCKCLLYWTVWWQCNA